MIMAVNHETVAAGFIINRGSRNMPATGLFFGNFKVIIGISVKNHWVIMAVKLKALVIVGAANFAVNHIHMPG